MQGKDREEEKLLVFFFCPSPLHMTGLFNLTTIVNSVLLFIQLT
jgi:hypothetical protein